MKMKLDEKRILDYFSGEDTPKDRKYIESLFTDAEREEELKEILARHWDVFSHNDSFPDKNLKRFGQSSLENTGCVGGKDISHIFRKIWKAYARVAAMLLLPLGVLYLVYEHGQERSILDEVSSVSINAPLGSKLQFTLPDGSKGWLNSGSKLTYPPKFGDTRDVYLIGEAWFDVKKSKDRPFNVVTPDVDISVLGTKFNVVAYKGEKTDVVLESGKVLLKPKGNQKELSMEPSERVIIDAKTNSVSRSNIVGDNKFSSWKEGKLVFRNDSMEDVAKRLSRWYNIDVTIENNKNKNLRLRAVFVDEDIDEVLRLLKMSFPIDYHIEDRRKDERHFQFSKRKVKITVR
ncbi:FecR domain-containing protein [uncultured Zobellia sp.]|uniref:FecR family protein n=1 Tax=uncultured Zobellia sp. TaxID=255433 RepID=UPI002592D339|nr:FecR domain-containing protein [uncultured Zobellia sp.]